MWRIKAFYYNILYGIQNLWKWRKIIWQDRDWDYVYIYEMLYFKLKNMEKHIKEYGRFIGSERVVHELMVCKNLCKRLMNDDYLENALIPVEKKYGNLKYHWEDSDVSGFKTLVFDECKDERKARNRAYEHAGYMKRQDKRLLFDMMCKHIDGWWD